MLAIANPLNQNAASKRRKVLTPNLLPCKITHSGPIPTPKRHWNPQPSSPSTSNTKSPQTAYFRGRKLRGTTLTLPSGYEGKVLLKTNTLLAQAPRIPTIPGRVKEEEEEEEEEIPEEVKQLETMGTFEEVVIWGHESVPGEGEGDVYIQGLEEWPGFAERIHAFDMPGTRTTMATTT